MDQNIYYKGHTITIRRDDLLHRFVSGNKFRKLKYNLQFLLQNNYKGVITFGGAFSNHISATAAAARISNINSIGIIRGDEFKDCKSLNTTLSFAKKQGMELLFISREEYKNKNDEKFLNFIKNKFPEYYIIPEGGSNELAIKGCKEIITEIDSNFKYIFCACGTGATLSGIILNSNSHTKIIGIPVLKDFSLIDKISQWTENNNWELNFNYHFGGYAKTNDVLIDFINNFFNKFGVPLDPVYTGKLFYAIFDMIDKNIINKQDKILAIHTGGLQGIEGMNILLKKKNRNLIQYNY